MNIFKGMNHEVPFYSSAAGARKSGKPGLELKRAGVSGRQRKKFIRAARKAVKAASKAGE